MISVPKTGKLLNYINHKMKVTLNDDRWIVGKLMAYDKFMNVVLGDAEEFRRIVPKKTRKQKDDGMDTDGKKKDDEGREEKRTLGLTIIRGETIVSMTVINAPPKEQNLRADPSQLPGAAKTSAGRGLTVVSQAAPAGLAAPARGVGGPSVNMMPSMMPGGMPAQPLMNAPPMGMPPAMASFMMMGAGRGLMPPPGMPQPFMNAPMGMPPGMPQPFMNPPPMGMPPGGGLPPGLAPPPGMPANFPFNPPGGMPPGLGRGQTQ